MARRILTSIEICRLRRYRRAYALPPCMTRPMTLQSENETLHSDNVGLTTRALGRYHCQAIDEQPDPYHQRFAIKYRHIQGEGRGGTWHQVLLSLPWSRLRGGLQGTQFSSSSIKKGMRKETKNYFFLTREISRSSKGYTSMAVSPSHETSSAPTTERTLSRPLARRLARPLCTLRPEGKNKKRLGFAHWRFLGEGMRPLTNIWRWHIV